MTVTTDQAQSATSAMSNSDSPHPRRPRRRSRCSQRRRRFSRRVVCFIRNAVSLARFRRRDLDTELPDVHKRLVEAACCGVVSALRHSDSGDRGVPRKRHDDVLCVGHPHGQHRGRVGREDDGVALPLRHTQQRHRRRAPELRIILL